MDKVIKLAQESGWKLGNQSFYKDDNGVLFNTSSVLLDPHFWQALGKAEGWEYQHDENTNYKDWRIVWHSFIDHLASGGDADSFFTSLTKQV